MEELEKNIVRLFKEEHEDWVNHIKEAEEGGTGIDINLGGNFAGRLEQLLAAIREYKLRQVKKKKGWF